MAEREELILEVRTELQQARADIERLESQLAEIEGRTVEVDLTVDDEATEAIEGVVEDVNALDGETAETALSVDDQASAVIGEVAADVEALDGATASTLLDVDDQASDTIAEVVDEIDDLDGSTATATIEVDDEVTDAAEEALDALENIDDTFTATIEVEGADTASEAVGGIAEGLGEIAGGQGLAALSAAGFLAIGRNAADAVLDVQGLATATAASLEEASRLKEAWEQAGGSMDTLERNVIRANEQIRESPGLAASLGIQINENTSAYDIFVGAVNALNSGQLTASERLGLAMDVFGSRGVLILNDLQTRVGDLGEFMAQVGENEIITQEQVDQAVAFEQSWDAVGDAMAAIGREVLPAVASSAERIAGLLESWPIERLVGGFELMGVNVSLIEAALGGGADDLAGSAVAIEVAAERLREATQFNDPTTGAWGDYLEITREAAGATEEVALSADRLNEAYARLGDPLQTMPELWQALIQDARDGAFEWENAAGAIAMLTEATGLSEAQILSHIEAEAEQVKVSGDMQAAIDESAAALLAEREALAEVGQELATVARNLDTAAIRAAGFSSALDQINESSELTTSNEVINFVDSMNSLGDSLRAAADAGIDLNAVDLVPDSWGEVLNMPEELGPVVDAITAFRGNVQSEMAQAFESGGQAEVLAWAESTRDAIVTSLNEAGVTSEEAVNQVLSALGLLPEQIDMAIALSGQEQALATIALMQGAIDGLPTEVQLQIAAVAATDPLAALELAIQGFQDAGIAVPVELTILAAQLEADIAAVAATPHEATVTAVADTDQAETDITDFADEDRTATVTAEADPIQAATDLLDLADEPRSALIVAHARTAGAEIDLDAVAEPRTATVNVVTGNIDVPTQAQLAARIGPVRVQIIGVWSTRLEGSRPI